MPGGAIDNPTLSTVGDDLGTMAGTSASAAKAAGMASKVWESNPDLSVTQVIDILTGSAIDLKEPGWDEETGFGVVNLNKAVQLAKETAPQAYIPTPFSNPTTWGLEGLVTPLERATADEFNGKYYDWVSYTIQSGDTLSQIAVDTMGDASPDAYNLIAQHNGISNPDEIFAGQEIQIPQEVSAPPQQPPSNDNQNVDFNPPSNDNQNVDFNPPSNDNQNVDFNPPTNNNQNVDFNPPTNNNPNVDFNPPTNNNSNVDFNPPSNDNQNVDFNPPSNDNQNVDFNPPPVNSINLNGHIVSGNFYPVFQNYQGTLGDPITNVTDYNGVSYQLFENGSIVSSANGTFPLSGAIRQEFLNTGGLNGRLGAPTSEEKNLGGNSVQYFEHGHIYWNGSKAIAYQEGDGKPSVSVPPNQPISGKGNTIRTGDSGSGNGTLIGGGVRGFEDKDVDGRNNFYSEEILDKRPSYQDEPPTTPGQTWDNPSELTDNHIFRELMEHLVGVQTTTQTLNKLAKNVLTNGYLDRYYENSKYRVGFYFHSGFDIGIEEGETVYSLVGGDVILAGGSHGTVTIHNSTLGKTFVYMHMKNIKVAKGPIKAGEPIGEVSWAGLAKPSDRHLHFEVQDDQEGQDIDGVEASQGKESLRTKTFNPLNAFIEAQYKENLTAPSKP